MLSKTVRHGTYSEVFRAAFCHQLVRLGLVLVIQCVQIETGFLQCNITTKLQSSCITVKKPDCSCAKRASSNAATQ